MTRLIDLKNIGKVTAAQLEQVGIHNLEDLQAVGSKEAWARIKEIDSSACVNRLMGIEGALQDIIYFYLSEEDKADLKNFFNNYKSEN